MLKLFIDFDNTITIGDVGDALFMEFGGAPCARSDEEYRAGRLSAKECLLHKCSLCGEIELTALDAFIDAQIIDPTFPDFISFCHARRLEFFVVSDGLDYYIRRILQNHGLKGIPFFSNVLQLEPVRGTGKVRLIPSFPHDDEDCDRCACCKRNIMLMHTGENEIIVYIGDGYSDQCPVKYADIAFAKPELQSYCQRANISYYEFQSFRDVQARLEKILAQKRIRKRCLAEANRQALFLAG